MAACPMGTSCCLAQPAATFGYQPTQAPPSAGDHRRLLGREPGERIRLRCRVRPKAPTAPHAMRDLAMGAAGPTAVDRQRPSAT